MNFMDILKTRILPKFVSGLSTILIMTQFVFFVGFTIPFMIIWIVLLFPMLLLYLVNISLNHICRRPRNKYTCIFYRVDGAGEIQMSYELKDYLNAINYEKKNLMDTDDEMWEKKYPPYVVNRCLAPFRDTIMLVNEMNKLHHLDKKLQFDFLLNSIRTRKRFIPWIKKKK